ncbi:hypothetical protein A2U01_0090122, partial [Trifolium medium]|nr:hypothetical protein [Trifolium medium]
GEVLRPWSVLLSRSQVRILLPVSLPVLGRSMF